MKRNWHNSDSVTNYYKVLLGMILSVTFIINRAHLTCIELKKHNISNNVFIVLIIVVTVININF